MSSPYRARHEEDPVPETMQAVVCHGPRDYRMEKVTRPEPGPGQALVRVQAVGICASDLKCYQGAAKFWGDANRPAWAETEVIPGHEFVGEVVELDAEAALLARRHPDDRVRSPSDGPHLHPPATAGAVPGGP
jgi:threonine dehydrogenase-like Zn-dependent dehydrogenase